MNQLTVVDRGGVKVPEILTVDAAQNLLDQYGTGGKAVKIPDGVDLQKFLGRCNGGFYFDNAITSGSIGGPIEDLVYYTVINGGVPGNRAIIASSHGNNLWIAEVYGDVFRGWVTFSRPADVTAEINKAIDDHEKTTDHPYATENNKGFVELADTTEGNSGTDATKAMTSARVQGLLSLYGLGQRSVDVPEGANLGAYFNDKKPGMYRLVASTSYTNAPGDAAFTWAEVLLMNQELTNSRTMLMITNTGRTYTATVNAASFSGWKLKMQPEDLPIGSVYQRGMLQLLNSVSSTDVTMAATANAVKVAYDTANTKVPLTRMINGQYLYNDIWITAATLGVYTKAEVNNLIAGMGSVQDIRWSNQDIITSVDSGNGRVFGPYGGRGRFTNVPAAGVVVNIGDSNTSRPWLDDVDTVWFRYLQKQMWGAWYTVGAL